MVSKLFKYEAKYYLRLFIPFGLIVLATALFMRILFEFKMDNVVYDIVYGSTQLLFGVSIAVCFGTVTALSITRFYKNLYGSEGYLSFTLPVTATAHITSKLLASFVFYMSALLVSFVGFAIATAGEVFTEFVKAGTYLFELFFEQYKWKLVLFIFEILMCALAVLVFEILLFYTCISLGQIAKKAKVLMSFVYYFIYYAITQVIGTVLVIVITVLSATGDMERILKFFIDNIDWIIHAAPIGFFLAICGISAIFFVVNRSIMTKKLNLE